MNDDCTYCGFEHGLNVEHQCVTEKVKKIIDRIISEYHEAWSGREKAEQAYERSRTDAMNLTQNVNDLTFRLSTANKKSEKLVEALEEASSLIVSEYCSHSCKHGDNEHCYADFIYRALKEFRGGV
jgi:hypothetical protein